MVPSQRARGPIIQSNQKRFAYESALSRRPESVPSGISPERILHSDVESLTLVNDPGLNFSLQFDSRVRWSIAETGTQLIL